MNLQLILIFIFSILFVTIYSDELVPLKQSTPNPVVIKKGGDNKLHIDVSWEGLAIGEKDKVVTKLTCFSTAVTVKDSPQVNCHISFFYHKNCFFFY
ncbi:hypothetical protein RhiirA1_78354 [Rhizophagus irregularis]|uniref:Uncharacterized protein n=1 Tax=Rhizophagus irregularis TaxID=588596 RepID=A0A2N0R2D8_9GLOM|nr:hypothetical protein RhiirA1_78354 [Rhizophagus irregularis]